MIHFKKTGLIGRFTNLTGKTISAISHDIHYETDQQMLVRVGSKFALTLFIILMFDPLSDVLLGIFQAAFELLHLFMEFIEDLLESILQYVLKTGKHQSEVIIVNSAIIFALYGLYRLYFAIPNLIFQLNSHLHTAWQNYINRQSFYWRMLPFERKLKLVSTYILGFTSLLFMLSL